MIPTPTSPHSLFRFIADYCDSWTQKQIKEQIRQHMPEMSLSAAISPLDVVALIKLFDKCQAKNHIELLSKLLSKEHIPILASFIALTQVGKNELFDPKGLSGLTDKIKRIANARSNDLQFVLSCWSIAARLLGTKLPREINRVSTIEDLALLLSKSDTPRLGDLCINESVGMIVGLDNFSKSDVTPYVVGFVESDPWEASIGAGVYVWKLKGKPNQLFRPVF